MKNRLVISSVEEFWKQKDFEKDSSCSPLGSRRGSLGMSDLLVDRYLGLWRLTWVIEGTGDCLFAVAWPDSTGSVLCLPGTAAPSA